MSDSNVDSEVTRGSSSNLPAANERVSYNKTRTNKHAMKPRKRFLKLPFIPEFCSFNELLGRGGARGETTRPTSRKNALGRAGDRTIAIRESEQINFERGKLKPLKDVKNNAKESATAQTKTNGQSSRRRFGAVVAWRRGVAASSLACAGGTSIWNGALEASVAKGGRDQEGRNNCGENDETLHLSERAVLPQRKSHTSLMIERDRRAAVKQAQI